MKQIWPNYSYSPATNILTLTGLNIDRDQLLLVTAADRGRIMYNFADSSVTASAFTSGANTALTLVATTAGLTTTAALVIYYDDQLASNSVTVSSLPAISGTVTAGNLPIYNETDTIVDGSVVGSLVFDVNGRNAFGASGVTVGSIPSLPTGTNRIGVVTIGGGTVTIGAGTAQIGSVTVGNSVTIGSLPAISGTVTANVIGKNPVDDSLIQIPVESYLDASSAYVVPVDLYNQAGAIYSGNPLAVGGTVTIGSALPAGTNRIGVVTIGAGTVTIGAGTAQIGSVTASISGTVPISISSVTVGNSVTIGSLPAISGTVTAVLSGPSYVEIAGGIQNYVFDYTSFPISGTVTANTFAVQGTAVTTSNFTSTTASTVLASFNATREVLTIFNEGAGNLHIAPGATCTTIAYQVRLSAGDYYEVPNHQTTITHSAVFATAGTARVTEVS
jgi:hypothetical protein